jgi:SAM-dependent methyltransferase
MSSTEEYLLGMQPAEIARLEQQHAVWRALTNRLWDLAGFGAGWTIVDLGSGPGFTSVELAGRVGHSGRVIAVDASATATDRLRATTRSKRLENVHVITADAREFDPAPWKPDGLFARWLFCFIERPEDLVRRIASGLRTGAVVAVMDYWNYLAIRTEPGHPLFAKVFKAVYDSFAEAGGSLDVAGRLPRLLDAEGLTVTHVEPLCQIGRPGSPLWAWLCSFQQLYLPTMVQKGYLSAVDLETYEVWWRRQDGQKSTILFAPPILGVTAVKR